MFKIVLMCTALRRSLSSILPWDIPWYDPSHAVFFATLYCVLAIIGIGFSVALLMTMRELRKK